MGTEERYTICKKIADGGMAEVFVATQGGADGFARMVVLKRILPSFSADPQFRTMLVDEAHIVMTLNHGNIVPVLDLAQRDGWYFLVMELVDGWDLASILGRAEKAGLALPLGLALHVTAEVCRGLAYAHAAKSPAGKSLGLVHRDISPQNVLVSEHGEVRVTDFGIAKALGKRTCTKTGVVKGNVDYMSPEQASGAPVDASSDVFSAGAMLYRLVTGQRPFQAPSDLDALRKVQKGEFAPPEQVNAGLPPAVAGIVNKAMQLRPSQRYRGAREMMLEIEEVLRSEFRMAGKSELHAWLADLSKRDGELPASRRPGLPMDQKTMIISPADIVSVEDTSGASALDATSAPGAAPVEAEAEELAPPRPLWRQRALLALGVAAAMATAIAVSSTFARRDPPGREPAKALTGTAEEREAPPKPSATAPPVVGSVREPDRRSAVSRAPSRISRQKSSPGQKTAATRKLPAKRQPNSRQGS